MVIMLITRWYLARENAKRDAEKYDSTYDNVYLDLDSGSSGEKVTEAVKVDKVRFLIHVCLLSTSYLIQRCIRHSWT